MCGIIGFSGLFDSKKILLDGLSTLEYRGYDSAGISFFNDKNNIEILKTIGKVENLRRIAEANTSTTTCGIGHTRWATHGGVTNENAHPHIAGSVCMVHNGIVENYLQLMKDYNIKQELRKSETDTEVAAIVLDIIYNNSGKDPLVSIKTLVEKITGSFSFSIMFKDRPNEIYAIRKINPLVCATTDIGSFLSSDLIALMPYTKEFFLPDEMTIIKLTPYNIKIYDLNTFERLKPKIQSVTWTSDAAKKDGYPYYMIKEINEQPKALFDTIMPRVVDGIPNFTEENITDDLFKTIDHIQIIACGTARHAGLVAANLFSPILGVPINSYVASEYKYSDPIVNDKTLCIFISQSGETIDTKESQKIAKDLGGKTLAIVNVKCSSIAREADYCLYTNAGPELSVASTKAYTVQIALLYILFARIAYVKNKMTKIELKEFTDTLLSMQQVMKATIENDEVIKRIAKFLKYRNDCFYIGRLQDYVSSLEGALKLKEISYIHTDAYAAGELKHGTIALIDDGVPVIAINTNKKTSSILLSNVEEVKARNAKVILVINEDFEYKENLPDFVIKIKNVDSRFAVFPVSVVTQLIAYYTTLEKGFDVDHPRNLAKSVTVE